MHSKILNEHDLITHPVLIAYANDKEQQAEALLAKGVQLLHLPQQESANTRVNLKALLHELANRGCNEVLIEAGHGLNGGFLQSHLIDECILYFAPKIMGGDAMPIFAIKTLTQMSQAIDFEIKDMRQFGQDIRLILRPRHPSE